MRNMLLRITSVALVLLILLFIGTSWLKLRPSFYPFQVQEIDISADTSESAGTKLDAILLRNLQIFNHIYSFDRAFKMVGETKRIKKDLWINHCETSQKEFQQFIQWQKISQNKNIASAAQPSTWSYKSNTDTHLISGKFSAPANGITYYDAYAYCRAAGGRLPYRHEWVAAASGKTNRLYAMGDQLNLSAWPYLEPLHNAAQSCGLHKDVMTPDKISDMNNNVSEWVQNANNPAKPIIIGGNAYNKPYEIYALNALYRFAPPEYRSPYVGFRCIYPSPPVRTPWNTEQIARKVSAGNYAIGIPKDAKIPNLITELPRNQIHTVLDMFNWQENRQVKKLYVTTHEITREQYNNFLKDIFVRLGLYADENEPKQHSYYPPDWEIQMQAPYLPVTNIDWWSAYAFANWASGRLLSAEEWAWAASDGGRYIYPGKNIISNDFSNQSTRLQTPGENSNDVTTTGLHDMGSNVSEWTQSVTVADGAYSIVVKGGNYLLPPKLTARIDFKNYVPQHYQSTTIGFRIAFDRHPRSAYLKLSDFTP